SGTALGGQTGAPICGSFLYLSLTIFKTNRQFVRRLSDRQQWLAAVSPINPCLGANDYLLLRFKYGH
ncbi:MAG: hypothetical protein L0K81_06845, partial [Lactococcus sp.]|nr:hypothetical protein [Lactococcus sp.]